MFLHQRCRFLFLISALVPPLAPSLAFPGALALVLAFTPEQPAAAAPPPPVAAQRQYDRCMMLSRSAPERALAQAEAWIQKGGGAAARHCLAIALLNLGRAGEAAAQLESLADSFNESQRHLRGGILGQAAQAWQMHGDLGRARTMLDEAINDRPDDPLLLTDRAVLLAASKQYWEAIDDLNESLSLDDKQIDALIFRAAAYRLAGVPEMAWEDVDQVLHRVPDHPEAIMERAMLALMAGDEAVARRDLRRVLELRPKGILADAAHQHLERLDLRVKPRP